MGYKQLSKTDREKFPLAAQVFKASQDEIFQRVQPSEALIVLKAFIDG